MSLNDKIEEIRSKPEHIRMRYVWLFVAVSMILVIILWIFSLKNAPKNDRAVPSENSLFSPEIINQFGEQKNVLEDMKEKSKSALPNLENSGGNPLPDEKTK